MVNLILQNSVPFFGQMCTFVSLWSCFLSGLPTEQAQWRDLDGIITMLEDVSNEAFQRDQDPQTKRRKFRGEINALVDMLKALDRYI